ncbi:MAG: 2-amino-4-hydroxy-6-hydroxymethyldihydropteridine diphosphokinase [Defluviitaleaceae bacterium]|nr:2-amino-4-hydroxy-6-hydroxymethyldihydropteridine diphosphokinase [Defluviitaleaceae bacterium]
MDKIIIKNLEVFANHGVLEAEKDLGQKFIVNCELNTSLREAGKSDDIYKTINYAKVCRDIAQIMQDNTYNLIESCAEMIANHILANYAVNSLTVTIEKPWAPIGMRGSVFVEIYRAWHRVYLGLGSNIGDTTANLDNAIKEMECPTLKIIRKSTYHNTEPVSSIPQDDYLNCVVEITTTFTPRELMEHLLDTEKKLGRIRDNAQHWGPRVIDIDILTYDDIISDDPTVILPHPLMHRRLFVLAPFCELNPHYLHPVLRERIQELKDKLEE